MALVTLGELGGNELRARAAHDLALETDRQFVEQQARAAEIARLQDGGADRHVAARQRDALLDTAGGVSDLEAHVPQQIEHEFDRRLAPGLGAGRQQEQQVDVRARRQRATAIAAHGGHRNARGLGGHGGIEDMVQREVVDDGNQLVLQPGKPRGAGKTTAVGEKQFARLLAPKLVGLLQFGQQRLSHAVALFGVGAGDEFAFGPQGRHVEQARMGRYHHFAVHRIAAACCLPASVHLPVLKRYSPFYTAATVTSLSNRRLPSSAHKAPPAPRAATCRPG